MTVFLIELLRIAENDAEHRGKASLAAACARAIRETHEPHGSLPTAALGPSDQS
jgi:hypothetical protein